MLSDGSDRHHSSKNQKSKLAGQCYCQISYSLILSISYFFLVIYLFVFNIYPITFHCTGQATCNPVLHQNSWKDNLNLRSASNFYVGRIYLEIFNMQSQSSTIEKCESSLEHWLPSIHESKYRIREKGRKSTSDDCCRDKDKLTRCWKA